MTLRKNVSEERHKEEIIANTSEKIMEICEELHLNHKEDADKHLEALTIALEQLNTQQRTSIHLFYLQDKSYKEITDITGMNLNEVKSHIQNGKRNLKTLLKNYDVE